MIKYYKVRVAFFTYICFILVSSCGEISSVSEQKKNIKAYEFSLKSLDGNEISLKEFQGKKAVYLVFWATWCPACKKDIPRLKMLSKDLNTKEIELLTINVGSGDSLDKIAEFKKKYDISYTILYDEGGKVSKAYKIVGIPTHILIDRNGIIRYNAHSPPHDISGYLKKFKG